MRRDHVVRILALVVLCGLVYWFSYDQGRSAFKQKVAVLEAKVREQQEIIETKSLQLRQAEARLRDLESVRAREQAADAESASETAIQHISLTPKASRTLFEAKLILTCLHVDRDRNQALLQLTLVQEGRVRKIEMGLGSGVRFEINDREYMLVLEKIQSSTLISVQIIEL